MLQKVAAGPVLGAITLTALIFGGCGDDEARPAAAAPGAVATRCGLSAVDPGDTVPAGLLPADSVVTAHEGGGAVAIVSGDLATVYAALKANAAKAGLDIGASEREGFDAEIELEGDGGRYELALQPAQRCDGATEVRVGTE